MSVCSCQPASLLGTRACARFAVHHTLPTAPSPVTTHCRYRVSYCPKVPAVILWLPTLRDCVAGAAMLAPSFELLALPLPPIAEFLSVALQFTCCGGGR